MVFQPVRGVVTVRMKYRLDFENVENVFHVAHDSLDPWPLAQMEDLASTFEGWEDTSAKPERGANCQLEEVIVVDETSLTTQRVTRGVVPPVVGTHAGDSLPNNATLAIKADINNRGRGKSGRTFWIGLTEGQVTANTINTANRDNIVAALNALRTAVTSLNPGYDLVTVHRVVNGVHPAEADYSVIAAFSASDTTMDSQRTRLPGHKRRRRRVTTP